MAYDWTSHILFWTSSTYRTVSAFKVTDGSRRDIVQNLKYPRGIAVHPSAGYEKSLARVQHSEYRFVLNKTSIAISVNTEEHN